MKALAITAAVVFGVLAAAFAWFTVTSDPLDGEPVATIAIVHPTTESGGGPAAAPAAPPPTQRIGDFQLPPGVSVIGIDPDEDGPRPPSGQMRPPGAPPPAASSAAPGISVVIPDAPQAAPPAPPMPPEMRPEPQAGEAPAPGASLQSPALEANVQRFAPDGQTGAAQEGGAISLPPVPVADLVETSQYGPLPRVASDGRRPLDVYARPAGPAGRGGLGEPARIAILVSGLGISDQLTGEAIQALPGSVSVALSAYSQNGQDWVAKARAAGHEVLLQLPLEPYDYPDNDPGPQTLLTSLPPEENIKRLQWLLSRFTGYVGVTNHMGAKFASAQDAFLPMLEELKGRGLLYVDDGSAPRSTAAQIAATLGLDYSVAQVQIDSENGSEEVMKSLAQLEAIAKERGAAIGVATARPATIKHIADWAEQLDGKGIVLIPVSAAVQSQRQT
jgi:uncharacterized protein